MLKYAAQCLTMRGRELSASGHGHRGKNKPPKTSYFFRTKKGINSICSLGTKTSQQVLLPRSPLPETMSTAAGFGHVRPCQISPSNACARDVARFTT